MDTNTVREAIIDALGRVGELDEKKMDPVGQADADIDNDGDVDNSDEYLHKRRKAIKKAMKEEQEARLNEATAMTAGPKGSLGGIGKKPSMPAPGDSKRTINAPKGTARHHADMAAKHQQSAEHHGRRASEHEDEGNDDKADHHYDKMQHHDNAADAHQHAQDMIKKHGSDHPEAQKASKEANKHKLS